VHPPTDTGPPRWIGICAICCLLVGAAYASTIIGLAVTGGPSLPPPVNLILITALAAAVVGLIVARVGAVIMARLDRLEARFVRQLDELEGRTYDAGYDAGYPDGLARRPMQGESPPGARVTPMPSRN
jgi:hypothetical protein